MGHLHGLRRHAAFILLAQITASAATYHSPYTSSTAYQLAHSDIAGIIRYLHLAFAITSLLKILGPFLDQKNSQYDFARRKHFFYLIFLAALSLAVSYLTGFIEEQKHKIISLPTLEKSAFGAVEGVFRAYADCFFYAGLLLLLEWRLARPDSLNGLNSEPNSSTNVSDFVQADKELQSTQENELRTVSTKSFRVQSTVYVSSMALTATARAIVRGLMVTDKQIQAYKALSHLFLGFYCHTTLFILFTVIKVWRRRSKSDSVPWALSSFDNRVIKIILYILSPILIFRMCYSIATEVLDFTATAASDGFNWNTLILVDIIITGLTYLALLGCSLWLGRPWKML